MTASRLDRLGELCAAMSKCCDPIIDLPGYLDSRSAYDENVTPEVVLRLIRVAKAAAEKRDAAHAINHTVAGAWEAGCKRYDAATEALSAALSAVEGT